MNAMLFLKVPAKKAEAVRRELAENGALSKEYAVIKEGGFVLLPLQAGSSRGAYETVELEVPKRPVRIASLKEALRGVLSDEELESLTASFDIMGDVAIIEVPEALEGREREIGEAVLLVHKNVRCVYKKLGGMEGEYRVRRLGHVAGENRTETEHRESGVRMRLDVAKAYFSVRLSHERKRIAELVKPGERVLVLFAGVGPFALVIAKKRPKAEITAVELNPDAVLYMRENVELNRAKNVHVVEGDAMKIELEPASFDRVVMPLPKTAHEFLGVAFAAVKSGGIVHFYSMGETKDPYAEPTKKAQEAAKAGGVEMQVASKRIVRPYSPALVQVVLDLKIKKHQAN